MWCGGEGAQKDATTRMGARRSTVTLNATTVTRSLDASRDATRLARFQPEPRLIMNNFFQVKSTGKKASAKEKAEEDENLQPWVEK